MLGLFYDLEIISSFSLSGPIFAKLQRPLKLYLPEKFMKKLLMPILLLLPTILMAENKFTVDMTIDDLKFTMPKRGVGRAGQLVFKKAAIDNSGIILNLNNVNKIFDSEIFIRPTFLGFKTQFGDYGFALSPENELIKSLKDVKLANTNFILDSNQLNVAGETLKFISTDLNLDANNFRLYCQSPIVEDPNANETDILTNCLTYMTLNGTYGDKSKIAQLKFINSNPETGDVTNIKADVNSIDIRKNKINIDLVSLESVSNDSYEIKTSPVQVECAKDPSLVDLNVDKLTKDCLNKLRIKPLEASLNDKAAKSKFNLSVKDITVQDQILYASLNRGVLSDTTSTTTLTKLLLNCHKGLDTDMLELTQLLRDCLQMAKISIGDVTSTKPDEKSGSSVKNIAIGSNSGSLVVQADIKLLGFNSRVSIYGKAALDEVKKELYVNVTDTKLPLGLSSVKILMYFLKKNFISKDINFNGNKITIAL